jgi:DNA-directed RNA polymerase specialized sigma24 family protein
MKAKNAVSVPPLTSTKLDGTPYVRHADVTAAIAQALSLPQDQWEEWAARSDATRMPGEVLVFLVKATAGSDRNLFGRLVWQLNLRIEAIAKRWSRGFDPHTTEEVLESVARRVLDIALVTSPTRQSDFLEVAFSKAVKRHTINVVEKRRNAPVSLTAAPHAGDEDDEDDLERPTETVVDEGPPPDELAAKLQDKEKHAVALRLAQGLVKDIRHYQAVILHYQLEWPLSSTDPAKPSLVDYFGVSERQIRNWMKDGRAAIRKALEDTHE